MKRNSKLTFLIPAALIFLLLGIGYLTSGSFFSKGGKVNPLGKAFNFFAYSWHYTRGLWYENDNQAGNARQEFARAVWHRSSRAKALLGIPSRSYYELGREYASLGLFREASCLLKRAFSSSLQEESRALDIISYLAIIGDWSGAAESAKKYLESDPASAEAAYWCGRALLETGKPAEALPFLRDAIRGDRSFLNAFYQLGRAEEELGGRKKAGAKWKEVTPRKPLKVKVENRFILLGYDFSPSEATTGEKHTLDLYLMAWRPSSLSFQTKIRLVSAGRKNEVLTGTEVFTLKQPGEVVKRSFSWEDPLVLYPGRVRLEIAFYLPEKGENLRAGGGDYLPLTSFHLKPAWVPAPSRDGRIRECFGPGARALGKKTFLGPGGELTINLKDKPRVAALGLISYSHASNFLSQGKVLAKLIAETEEGVKVFPVSAGRETAEVWWEYVPSWRGKHQRASIFASWPVSYRGKNFQAHEYYALFPFPRPLIVTSLKLKQVAGSSGLAVFNLILITPGKREE